MKRIRGQRERWEEKKAAKRNLEGVEKNCCQWKGLPGQLDLCVRVPLS